MEFFGVCHCRDKMTLQWRHDDVIITSLTFFDVISLVVTRGHSWSLAITREHFLTLSHWSHTCDSYYERLYVQRQTLPTWYMVQPNLRQTLCLVLHTNHTHGGTTWTTSSWHGHILWATSMPSPLTLTAFTPPSSLHPIIHFHSLSWCNGFSR